MLNQTLNNSNWSQTQSSLIIVKLKVCSFDSVKDTQTSENKLKTLIMMHVNQDLRGRQIDDQTNRTSVLLVINVLDFRILIFSRIYKLLTRYRECVCVCGLLSYVFLALRILKLLIFWMARAPEERLWISAVTDMCSAVCYCRFQSLYRCRDGQEADVCFSQSWRHCKTHTHLKHQMMGPDRKASQVCSGLNWEEQYRTIKLTIMV